MPPLLYLVRHADAEHASDDASRKLSDRGHGQVKELVRWLRPSGAFCPELIWHSPLVRARETAKLLSTELELKPGWAVKHELEPEAEPRAVVSLLGDVRKPLALVGHEPHLSGLASLLVTGHASPVVFAMQKATIVALEPAAGSRWSVRWQLSPDLFR